MAPQLAAVWLAVEDDNADIMIIYCFPPPQILEPPEMVSNKKYDDELRRCYQRFDEVLLIAGMAEEDCVRLLLESENCL